MTREPTTVSLFQDIAASDVEDVELRKVPKAQIANENAKRLYNLFSFSFGLL